MRLNLWKRVLVSLLLPVMTASAVVLYAVFNLGTISTRVKHIEIADDINLTLLELRRYEKNIILFNEEENIEKFNAFLEQMDGRMRDTEHEILAEVSREHYKALLDNIKAYKESAQSLIQGINAQQKLADNIRPMGRLIEKSALRKATALDLRRHEKNYLLYKERAAVDKLHGTAKELVRTQPSLNTHVGNYLNAFDAMVKSESLKQNTIGTLRRLGRAIQEITVEFLNKERVEIEKTISTARKLFIAAIIFLIVSTSVVGCIFSTNIVKTLKTLERSLGRLKTGDFSHGIEADTDTAPEEIASFIKTYNRTVADLGMARAALEQTLKKVEETNSELIERQDELVEARKLTAMRLLASEIAHEINNPMSSLLTFLGVLYEDMEAGDKRKETISLMLKEAGRCQAVLGELVDFARKEPLKLKEVNPAKLINEAIEVIRRQRGEEGISLTSSVAGLPEKVVIDPVLIYQALVNILTNAYDFTPLGGNIDIRGYAEDGTMTILIRDTGTGITPENIQYVFEPFFSTRKDIGSGLGLAITKKVIERHKGSIQVESKPGMNTIFKIKLPITAK